MTPTAPAWSCLAASSGTLCVFVCGRHRSPCSRMYAEPSPVALQALLVHERRRGLDIVQ
ncbi:hypothetical protein ACN28S_26045 [Cystobacter fuscus]